MARPPFPNEHTYAATQEIQRHDDAVHSFGEMTACIMMWTSIDFDRGAVVRCSSCYLAYGEVADAYEQPAKNRCLICYGTSFQGGIRAILYRPALWVEETSSEAIGKRGMSTVASARVQTVSEFKMRDGDYVVRSDNTRWRIAAPQQNEIITGFGPNSTDPASGEFFPAQLEDKTSVAYSIPVVLGALTMAGWYPYMIYPTTNDVINAALIYQWNDPVTSRADRLFGPDGSYFITSTGDYISIG